MADKIWTPEQELVFNAATNEKTSLIIQAYPGTGKTTTLVELAQRIKQTTCLATSFGTKTVEELRERLPLWIEVKTMNSVGHSAWCSAVGGRCEVDRDKMFNLVKKTGLRDDDFQAVYAMVRRARHVGLVPADAQAIKLVEDTEDNWRDLTDFDPSPELIKIARKVLKDCINLSYSRSIDFDDQIYMSSLFGGIFRRFKLVLVDEAQDLSLLNIRQIKRMSEDRIIAVGDEFQCHPPGTMIRVPDGFGGNERNCKPIENIKEGDEVTSYNTKTSFFSGCQQQGRKVLVKKEFDFDGDLVRIKAGEYTQLCTPEHRCLVRMIDAPYVYALYLMQRGNDFRVGIAQITYNLGFGPGLRARQESADALWVLKVSGNKAQALIDEAVTCVKFGLPDTMFKNNGKASMDQRFLDAIWDEVGNNEERAKICLKSFGRMFEFPFWKRQSELQDGNWIGKRSFLMQACNLLPNLMTVKIFNGDPRNSDWIIIDTEKVPYKGKVHGIEVQPNEGRRLYVADGIVTHNSIYAFRGADSNSMQSVRGLKSEWKDLTLSESFRCPQKVVRRRNTFLPLFRAASANAEGTISEFPGPWYWHQIPSGGSVAILSRNNAPIYAMATKLLSLRIPFQILGREGNRPVVALAKKILPKNGEPHEFIESVNSWKENETLTAETSGKHSRLESITDRAECLLNIIAEISPTSREEVLNALEEIFSETNPKIILSTVHRAKGLEYDTVVHLDPWRIPSFFASSADARQQEANILNVLETRTKLHFITANLKHFMGK